MYARIPRGVALTLCSCVHKLSHDYTTALTIYGYVCAHTPRKDFNIVYIHYHVSMHWAIANERAVLTSRDSQQPIRDHFPTWRRMGVYFTLHILLTAFLQIFIKNGTEKTANVLFSLRAIFDINYDSNTKSKMCTKDLSRNNNSYFYSATNNTWDSPNQSQNFARCIT